MNFQIIVCFNENGEAIKTIHLTGSPENSISVPHLRADPTTGNLLGARFGKSEIFVWNQNGESLEKLEMDKEISDFCSNKFGYFYFLTKQGIFSVLGEKMFFINFQKNLNIFRGFVSHQKLCLFKKGWKEFIENFQNYFKKKIFFEIFPKSNFFFFFCLSDGQAKL